MNQTNIRPPVTIESSSLGQIRIGSPVTVRTMITMDSVQIDSFGRLRTTQSSLWTGQGEPHLVQGASVGDEYIDTLTGTIYRLDPGA